MIDPIPPEEVVDDRGEPAVIFGQRNKLTADGPFLALLRAFEQTLGDSEQLTVIGYSFHDDHINTYISRWYNQSSKCRLRIVDPGFATSNAEFAQHLRSLIERDSDRITVYKSKAGEAIKDLFDTQPT